MTVESPIRMAVVGLGRVFERFHLPALQATEAVRLVAVWDADTGRRAWATGRLAGVPITKDLRELIDRSADAMLLLTPPATHAELACAALGAGLHVLVEKPMALDRAEAAGMARAARAAGRRLQIGFTRRFREPYRRLKAWLSSLDAAAAVEFDLRFPASSWGARGAFLGDDRAGGGVLDDVLSHQADLLRWLAGASPIRVRVTAHAAARVQCELEFPSGVMARCEAGHGSYRERLVIRRPGGALAATGSTFVTGGATAPWAPALASVADRAALAAARALGRPNVTARSFAAQLADFVAAVRGRETSGAGPEDGLAAVVLVEACRRSLDSGGWESVR
jgi:myo-inositol 2-dehydrogenase/D-chiro-inositol 1-dehydrogenase